MALDDADKKYIAELLAAQFSGDTLKKVVGEAAKAHVEAALKPFADKLDASAKDVEALKAAKATDKPADKEDKAKGGDKADPETAKELAALRQRLEASDKAREEAENRSKAEARDSAAREALAKAGIPADRLPHAMAFLGAQGVIVAGADGKPGWKGKDKFGVDAVLPLEDGARSWAATPDGKLYLPPTDARGTGTGAGNGSGSGGSGGIKKLGEINISKALDNLFT